MEQVRRLIAKGAPTDAVTSTGAAEPPAPRLREYFPETLLFEPALITFRPVR